MMHPAPTLPVIDGRTRTEHPDVASSTPDYARRFAGPVGRWFLDVQGRGIVDLLAPLGASLRVLDVGGGHGQLVPYLVEAGHEVVVLGSDPRCEGLLKEGAAAGAYRYEIGSLLDLPFADGSFDAVVSVRMMAHMTDWQRFLAELCRVAGSSVVIDFAATRSFNRAAERLFSLKKRIEGNTRPFRVYSRRLMAAEFAARGFRTARLRPQFFLPMVMHRALGTEGTSRAVETFTRVTGLTKLFGSPILLRADRVAAPRPLVRVI